MVKVKVIQLCPTLCNSMDYTVHGILQARILEWVAFSLSRASPNPGSKPRSPTLQADSLPAELQGKPKTYSDWGGNGSAERDKLGYWGRQLYTTIYKIDN